MKYQLRFWGPLFYIVHRIFDTVKDNSFQKDLIFSDNFFTAKTILKFSYVKDLFRKLISKPERGLGKPFINWKNSIKFTIRSPKYLYYIEITFWINLRPLETWQGAKKFEKYKPTNIIFLKELLLTASKTDIAIENWVGF